MGRGQSEWRVAPLRWGRGLCLIKKVCDGDLGQALENTEPAVDQQLCVKVPGWPPPTPAPHTGSFLPPQLRTDGLLQQRHLSTHCSPNSTACSSQPGLGCRWGRLTENVQKASGTGRGLEGRAWGEQGGVWGVG